MDRLRYSTDLMAVAIPTVVGAVLAGLFVWLFAAALHQPRPHELPVGLVAPDAVAARATGGLEVASPGAFAVVRFATAEEARASVEDRAVAGAFVAGPGTPVILVASGNSQASAGAISGAFGAIATASGSPATVEDVRPLPADDPYGVVPFFLVLGVSLSALVYQVLASATPTDVRLTVRLVAMVVLAVLAGLAAAGAVGLALGFDASLWLLSAVCALLALAVAAATAALHSIFGRAGLGLAALGVVILGAACSGGLVGPSFLPDGFRQLSPFMPAGVGLYAVRGTLYFDGADLVAPLAVLVTWIVISLGVLSAAESWRHRAAARPAIPAAG